MAKRVKCQICGQELGKSGFTSHLRAKHPDKLDEYQDDKSLFWTAVDEDDAIDLAKIIGKDRPDKAGFSHTDISVSPQFKGPEMEVDKNQVITAGMPPADELAAEADREEIHSLCVMLWNIPCIIYGDAMEISESHVRPFSRELYIYCQKKEIDFRDYIFDELGLILAGATLGMYTFQKYKAVKKDKKASKPANEKTRPADMPVVFDDPADTVKINTYTPVEQKLSGQSSSGGDNLPQTDLGEGDDTIRRTVSPPFPTADPDIITEEGADIMEPLNDDEIPEDLDNYEEI